MVGLGVGVDGCVGFGVTVGVGVEVGSSMRAGVDVCVGVAVGSAPAQAASSNTSMAEVKNQRTSFNMHRL